MRTKTHIIFDMDGTLVDSSELLANTINYVRKKIGLPALDGETLIRALNDTSLNPAQFYYEAEQFEPVHEKYFQEYYLANHHRESKLYEGVERLLEQLSANRALSVATNAYDVSARPLLKALGIDGYFDYLLCGDQVPRPKPHPQMLEEIINAYGVEKEAFVMVGDGERDLLAAQNAGIAGVLVQWGFSDHKTDAVQSAEALLKLLEGTS